MQIHPWTISSWPIIECVADAAPTIACNLRHLGTVVSPDRDEFGRLLGHTIWGNGCENAIGVAWDWTETMDGIFALADPMSVISNIDFVDDNGVSIAETMVAVQLNRVTYSLPWQAEVSQATREQRRRPVLSTLCAPTKVPHFRASQPGGFAMSR